MTVAHRVLAETDSIVWVTPDHNAGLHVAGAGG